MTQSPPRAPAALFTLALGTALAVAPVGFADAARPAALLTKKPSTKKPSTKKPSTIQPTTTRFSAASTSWSAGDPSIGIAAGLEVVEGIAKHAAASSKRGAKVDTPVFTLAVDILQTTIVLCDQAIAAAKKTKTKTKAKKPKKSKGSRAAKLSSLRDSLVVALTLAKQARDEQSAAKLGKVSSAVAKSSKQARQLAKVAHPKADLMISAVALRLVLAEAIAATMNGKSNAVIGEKGSNALIGEKGSNALIGEKGSNAVIGEKGSNALIGEKGSNAVIGTKGLGGLDADMLITVTELLDEVADGASLDSKAKPIGNQLLDVRDAVGAASKPGTSAWALRRALQSAEWANEALITEMQKP